VHQVGDQPRLFVHKSGAVRSVDWTFIIGVLAWRWLGELA